MTTLAAPLLFTDANGLSGAGVTYSARIRDVLDIAMMDTLDPISTGMIQLKVDLAGMGSDTMRAPFVGGFGWEQAFTALGSETATITADNTTEGYSSLTIGLYGLAHTQTFSAAVFGQPGTFMTLEDLISQVPASVLKTLRGLACTQGATISTIIGSGSDALDSDDLYSISAAMISTPGSTNLGMPLVTIHGEQMNQLRTSLRSDPAFQQSLQSYQQVAGAPSGQTWDNFLGLGFNLRATNDVVSGSGVYSGFAVSPGGMGWGKASVSRVPIPAAAEPLAMDDYGLLIARKLDSLGSATNGYEARLFVGVALADATVAFQRRIRSII